jgi:integrase
MDLSFFKVMDEEVDAVYLNWKELSAIYHLDLSEQPQLEKYRDLFVLGCLTGFRFSDYNDIKPEEVRDGMLYVTQTKTVSSVIVPLKKDARHILIEKYNMQMPQVSNVNFNDYIKEVAKLAGINELVKITHKKGNQVVEEIKPKYAWVTSHTCRRSFCTNEFLDGTPTNLIMAISGHKTEKAFRRYIKADQVQKAYMIKKIWENRPGL